MTRLPWALLAVVLLVGAVAGTASRWEGNNLVIVTGATATIGTRSVPNAAPNDGGTTQVYLEYGYTTLSTGTKTVPFKNAFAVKPACVCTDGTALAACDIPPGTVSTTQFVVNGTTSDIISWQCMGDR